MHSKKYKFKRRNVNGEFKVEGHCIPYEAPCHDCSDDHDHNNHRLNLAGLKDHLNYKLLTMSDCELVIHTTIGTHTHQEKGKIYNVGIDFIEIKNHNDQIITILKDKISHITVEEDCKYDDEDK
ncbi:hypothetical protein R4Z10_17465 [Niallia sp. XMNu-256]|uniref:hypothetical protein n=1 Tax=Niallia sp. XMNu-256 TaxID=3082444 RepID=UPI0030D00DCE